MTDDVLLPDDGVLGLLGFDDGAEGDPDGWLDGKDGVENRVAEIGAVNGTPVCGSGS